MSKASARARDSDVVIAIWTDDINVSRVGCGVSEGQWWPFMGDNAATIGQSLLGSASKSRCFAGGAQIEGSFKRNAQQDVPHGLQHAALAQQGGVDETVYGSFLQADRHRMISMSRP
jgi:hypothetical protein